MSLISPLLDGLTMGQPVNIHHGIQCCPALHEETNTRYMVKIISIPASQRQLEALLLTGAFPNELKAQEYFAELADAVVQEVQLLNRLSQAEGYLAYQGSQIVKMQEGVGFDVYLLAPYRESLEDRMRDTPLTHLEAVNLGLDLCAAMSVSRRCGYLHLNLKPANIYKTENRGYCIGDLGFIKLTSLKFASFPEKYRGAFTAPEIQDAMSPMNETLDIYALGLSLYQVYNNGVLPQQTDGPLPPPLYADYEMSAIILKACAANPAERWQTPGQMGQALVDYMQRNSVNDNSIVPAPVELPVEQVQLEEFLTEEENAAKLAALLADIPDELPPIPKEEQVAASTDSENEETDPEPASEGAAPEEASQEDAVSEELPSENGLTEDGVTEEVAQMLAQADELIEHTLPEPAVAPEPIDVPVPDPVAADEETIAEMPPEDTSPTPENAPAEPEADTDEDEYMPEKKNKKISLSLVIRLAAVALVLVAVGIFGLYYYNNIYTQTIDALHISGVEDQIVVRVETKANSSNLIVTCTDAYGNSVQSILTSGVALFDNMKPDTQYKIVVSITGRYKLVGQTTGTYTTGSQTKVSNFTATPGNEDGTLTLHFDVTGPDSKEWNVEYSATNIPAKTVTFKGHSVDFTDLNVGSVYTFRLFPADALYLTGETTLEYAVKGTILAEDLTISAYYADFLSVTWQAPQDVFGVNWIVRCYNADGYDQTIQTTATTQIFSRLEGESFYTIVVTAEGVTKSVSITTEGMTPIESAPQDPNVGNVESTDTPNNGGGDNTPDQPNNGDGGDTPDQPNNGGGDNTPDQPNNGGGDNTPDQPNNGGGDNTPDQPNNGGGDNNPDQPNNGGGDDTPDQPNNGGGDDTPDQPNNGGGDDTPDQPNNGGGDDTPDQPNNGGGDDTPDQPNNGGGDNIPDQPNNGGDNTPDQPNNDGGDNTPNTPNGGNNDVPPSGGSGDAQKPTDPNILTITGYTGSFSSAFWNMELSWKYTGPEPSGWIVTYTINGKNPIVIKCSQNYTNIPISRDNVYEFEVRPADRTKYVTMKWSYSSEELKYFNGNGFDAAQEKFSLVTGDSTTASSEFGVNDKVYLYVDSDKVDSNVTTKVKVTFVIRDSKNNILSAESQELPWNELWKDGVCKVQIPQMPTIPGGYAVDLFFDYFLVTAQDFQIN